MEWLKKVTDFIMPIENVEEEEEEQVETQVQKPVSAETPMEVRKVANGGTVAYPSAPRYAAPAPSLHAVPPIQEAPPAQQAPPQERPQLAVRSKKAQSLMIKLYAPTSFDQVVGVADDIKARRAVVINYEKVDLAEQRRICDFINGVCYVTNGDARRVTGNIVLYVPDGVDAEEAVAHVALG